MEQTVKTKGTPNTIKQLKGFAVNYSTFIVLLFIFIFFAVASPNFLRLDNQINVFRQISINGIIATGMTLVILTGGIDLSVGAVVAFGSVIAAILANENSQVWWISIIVAIGVATFLGFLSGVFISYFKLAPFIMTLAMMTIARGLAFTFSDGKPVSHVHKAFLVIGKGSFLGIPIPIWIFALVIASSFILTKFVPLGRYIFAIGGNELAAKISGINVRRVKLAVYVIAGFFTGIAAVVLTSRLSAGLPQVAQGYELDAIAAVVIGGTSLKGGKGSMLGTLIGIFIIGFINNGMDLLNIPSYPQQIIKGCVIILAVIIDSSKVSAE